MLAAAGAGALLFPGCGGGGTSNHSNGPTPGPADVYDGATLSPGFDMGVNTSGGLTNWVTANPQGYMVCAYPSGQSWGSIFIVAGTVTPSGSPRTTYDYSSYNYLALDLKGASGGELVSVGVKTDTDPDNGDEPLYAVPQLTTSWQTFKIPLTSLVNALAGYPATRFSHLYVVCELVFLTGSAETIYFRNVQYEK
jgi:hypothetical protein